MSFGDGKDYRFCLARNSQASHREKRTRTRFSDWHDPVNHGHTISTQTIIQSDNQKSQPNQSPNPQAFFLDPKITGTCEKLTLLTLENRQIQVRVRHKHW
jgi:hypothetical protein